MKKFFKKALTSGMLISLSISLAGCSWCNKETVQNNPIEIDTQPVASYTISELKNEYLNMGVKSNYIFKPFYNVEQTTKFTFHFNSMVDPVKAITVHTDSKCEEMSTVYQINDGYRVENGVDVVVKPNDAVLSAESGNNSSKKEIWGYAPIYYLCVRYDLDSTTVKKLDVPIVIPFTIRNEISTPNAYAYVSKDGIFSTRWHKVEDAVSYNIYRSSGAPKNRPDLSREECAYGGFGNSNRLKLIKSVDASTLEFIENEGGLIFTDAKIEDNMYISSDGYVSSQNRTHGYSYYITAVDAEGNESFFSRPVCSYKYNASLPYRIDYKNWGYGNDVYIKEFKDTIAVTQCDEKTLVNYPVNYYKLKTNYNNDQCTYRYEVVGTKLTGEINYYNESGIFPEEVISKTTLNTGAIIETPLETIPSVDIDSINDKDYANSKIDLVSDITYPEEAKIELDLASLYIRADLELARMIEGGIYSESLDTIESYVKDDNPEYIVVKHPNGVIEVKKNDGTVSNNTGEDEKTSEVEKTAETEKPSEVEKPAETEKPNEVEKPTETEKSNENKESNNKTEEDYKPDEIVNNNNYVDEQRKSTEKEVKEANKETVKGTNYPVFADTAAQKYLALSLINQEEVISLKAFPEYQNLEEFADDIYYVWYQNPYIMGIDLMNSNFSDDGKEFIPKYNVDKATAAKYQEAVYKKAKGVANSIITTGMSEQEKVVAIYTYLEKNAKYNNEAYEYGMTGANDVYQKYPNSWNTYGILCEGLGVCQSYAYAFNAIAYECNLDSIMVTGSMNNGGHAWNAAKIDNVWYMVDTTNNFNVIGAPYWVCNSSSEFIYNNGFVLNDGFVDGTYISKYLKNDDKEDWYYVEGLYAKTPEECADIWLKERNNNEKVFIKYNLVNEDSFMQSFGNYAIKNGAQKEELDNLYYKAGMGLLVLYTK